jgi:single-strand DNA-binding protein
MLRVTLLGNLGADPEVRYTQKGTPMVTFNVAVNQVRFGRDGERQENTEWFRIRVSGRQTEYVQRLSKGTRVLVIGRLDISHYQGKDGDARTGFDVWADDVQSMSARTFGAEGEGPDAESDAGMEPALAGVSSMAASGSARASTAGASASANGRGRPPTRTAPPAAGGESTELEDLPF